MRFSAAQGVVVVHDFAGMRQDLRNQAGWRERDLAAARDLYYWGSPLRCLWTIMREMGVGSGRTFDDTDSVRGWLPPPWHRQDRRDRVLHSRGLCGGAALGARILGFGASTTVAVPRTPSGPWRVHAHCRQLPRQGPLADGAPRRAAAGSGAHRAWSGATGPATSSRLSAHLAAALSAGLR
jgi:hypothetical protein